MARHRLTKEEQQKGVDRALESPRTPPQLKKGLQKRQDQLGGIKGVGAVGGHHPDVGLLEVLSSLVGHVGPF